MSTVEPTNIRSPKFIAFSILLILPPVLFMVLVLAAWVVSGDVYAAQSTNGDSMSVESWKRTLVLVCPLH